MIHIAAFQPDDLQWLDLQKAQRLWLGDARALDATYGAELAAAGPAWTVRDGSGWVLAACGFHEVNPGYAVAWALLAERLGQLHIALTRAVRRVFAEARYRRIDALIRADHPAGAKWARLVGMQEVFLIRAAGPAGEDFRLFEIVREPAHG